MYVGLWNPVLLPQMLILGLGFDACFAFDKAKASSHHLRIGIIGPMGAGKTRLVDGLRGISDPEVRPRVHNSPYTNCS